MVLCVTVVNSVVGKVVISLVVVIRVVTPGNITTIVLKEDRNKLGNSYLHKITEL